MPADYQSTARALALPIDDEDPISSPHLTSDPPWRRRRQSSNVNNSHPLDLSQASYRERAQYEVDRLTRRLQTTYRRLSPRQRILLVLAGIASFILGILFLVFVHQIFEYLKEGGEKWKNLRGGWCILWALTFAVAFPPMIGYSLCATLAGFIYGMPNGSVFQTLLQEIAKANSTTDGSSWLQQQLPDPLVLSLHPARSSLDMYIGYWPTIPASPQFLSRLNTTDSNCYA